MAVLGGERFLMSEVSLHCETILDCKATDEERERSFGFRGSGPEAQDSSFRFRVSGFGFCGIPGVRFWDAGFGIRDSEFRIRDSGFGIRVLHQIGSVSLARGGDEFVVKKLMHGAKTRLSCFVFLFPGFRIRGSNFRIRNSDFQIRNSDF